MKKQKHTPKASRADGKKSRRLTSQQAKAHAKRQKKQEKHAILPLHKRPIVCPPDKMGRNPFFRLFGYLCRILVIWAASAGLVIFVSSAMTFGVDNGVIAWVTLTVTACLSAILYNGVGVVIGCVGAVGGVAWLIATHPSLLSDLLPSVLALYNGALQRLYNVGYLAYIQYQVPVGSSTATQELLTLGVSLLGVWVATVFTLSLVRRVHIAPPAILATTFLVVILTFNVYTNRVESNLGIALVMVSFATVLVMATYDKLYHVKDIAQYDTEISLFGDGDRPTLPPEYVERQKERAEKKALAKKAKNAEKKPLTVDDELTAYFGGKPSKAKNTSSVLSSAEKKAQKKKQRDIHRQVRAVKTYDRVTSRAKSAMGGFAAAAVMGLCVLVIALPALAVKGNFNTIDAIDEKLTLVRDYVTAVLRGDDERLDELEYGADENNFKPHSTDLEHLEFTGKQIFYIESRFGANYYLRGWIGTDYEDGAWLAVDKDTLDAYRAMFDISQSSDEALKYNFYHYLAPSLVDDDSYTGENYLTKYQANRSYGFVTSLVHLRRVNSPSSLTYFPTSFKSQEGIFDYGTVTPSALTYVNYFDGIYTGRKFAENGTSHASVAYAQIMSQDGWAENQALLISAYHLQKETIMARECVTTREDGSLQSSLSLFTEERPDGTTLFSYQYKSGKDTRGWKFYHKTSDVERVGSTLTVRSQGGQLSLSLSGQKVMGAVYHLPQDTTVLQNAVEQYDNYMTDDQRAAFLRYLAESDAYAEFVYRTYTQTGNSQAIASFASDILQAAHIQTKDTVVTEYEDDPETPEYDPWTDVNDVWVDLPADVSLADVRSTSAAQTYIQRDLLVRNVIDYLHTELGCAYSLTPDLSKVDTSLDGVENFLLNTKEGYCVQFASATALILREMGIPTRYVEGYIASELSAKGSIAAGDYMYGGYVKDYETHTWVEVYFDGVGWVTYETTPAPQYYNAMYGSQTGDTSVPSTPILPEIETRPPSEEETLPEEVETTEESDTISQEEDDGSDAIMVGGLIGLCIIAVLVAIIVAIRAVLTSAQRAEDKRQDVVSQVLASNFGRSTAEEDRRDMAFAISDAVTSLLAVYGLAPMAGEFKEDYAVRLTAELQPPKNTPKADRIPALPDLRRVLNAMAAEEFGHGMTVEEMKLLASFYLRLRYDLKTRLSLPTRLYLRYIKHLI